MNEKNYFYFLNDGKLKIPVNKMDEDISIFIFVECWGFSKLHSVCVLCITKLFGHGADDNE